MPSQRTYIHDRIVLLLLTVNIFLAGLIAVTILLKLGEPSSGYIQQYRSNLGLNAFKAGESIDMLAFIVFGALTVVFSVIISKRIYHIKKRGAHIVLGLATILLVFSLMASRALMLLQ